MKMEIKARHRKLIEKKLNKQTGTYDLLRIDKFPKKIKFHVHITDGYMERNYFYKINLKNNQNNPLELYCKLSPTILLLYFNVTFWVEGEKWMKRY